MIRSAALIGFTLVFNSVYAQSVKSKIDSLKNILALHPKEDTIKLKLINSLASNYSDINPTIGLRYSDQAIVLAKKLNDSNQLKKAYFFRGNNFHTKGENKAAIENYLNCFQLATLLKHKVSMGQLTNNIGNAYFDLSNFDSALYYHAKSYSIFEEMKDTSLMCLPLNGIANDHMNFGNYPKAIEYYLRSLHLNETIKNYSETSTVLSNIGLVYLDMSEFSKSLEYFEKALSISLKTDNKFSTAKTFTYIGNAYKKMDDLKKAFEYYIKALEVSKGIEYKESIAENLANTGIIYAKQGNLEMAYENLMQANSMYEVQLNKYGLIIVSGEIGNLLLHAQDSFLKEHDIVPANRYLKCIELQTLSLRLSIEIKHVLQQSLAWERLSETYQLKGDYENSLNAYKQYKILQDSTVKGSREQEINRRIMQSEFENKQALLNAEHEKKESLAAAEIKRQKTVKQFLITGTAIVFLASIGIFFLYKRRRDAKAKQKEAEFKAQVADTEMKALRSQMNPHFIFNSLNSISDYISKNDIQEADNYLDKFAKLMRMILENSEQKEVTIADDLKALELYMQLEALRMNNKFTYEIKVDEDIDKENTLLPPLILQPFVENSIWHGISNKEGNGKILIHIKKEGDMINCIVEDNGIGRKQSAALKITEPDPLKKSLGMKITKARIDIVNKIKKSNATVELFDIPQGMRVEVKLPLSLSF